MPDRRWQPFPPSCMLPGNRHLACDQVEGRKRHEYLEAAVSVMDGHLRYFKAGYEALKKLEPFMHQASQSLVSLPCSSSPAQPCCC